MSAENANIQVEVNTVFHEKQSLAEEGRFVFSYKIRITNLNDEPVMLVSRYWQIIDGAEKIQEVNGQGVVGQQPTIPSGKSFEYSSGIILQTPTGIMHGHYDFVTENGEVLEAPIPAFTLANPANLH
jgi:ApaG protein